MTQERRKKIEGGAFDRASSLPQRDVEEATRQLHGQRSDAALAKLDKPEFASGKPMHIGRATATRTGLVLPKDLTAEEFRDIGTQIFTLEGITQWWIGDYLLYENPKWGDLIEKSAAYFGREVETLYNIVSVVRKFETSRRSEVLTFGHHALVAGKTPEKQDEYLAYAARHNLSIRALREYIQLQKKDPNADDTPPYEPVGTEYRKQRSELARLLRKKPTPEVRVQIATLVETLNARLLEEVAWLQEVQKLLTRSVGDKKKGTK